jgi:glycosyltransferase involved in cell wall biosynthesis
MKKNNNKNSKKKILFLSVLPPPYYGSAMSSKMCLDILKKSKEFEVENIKFNYSKEIEDVGKINLDKLRGLFYVKRQTKKEIQEFKPDLIYCFSGTYGLGLFRDWLFVREIKKHWKGKILFHVRSRIEEKHWNNKIFRKIYKKMFENGKAIVLDKSLKSDLHGLINEKDFFILPNAIKNEISNIDIKRILKLRRRNKTINILFLSHMSKTKGWVELLEACKILNEKDMNFICNFVGSWWNKEDERYFYNFIKEHKLEKRVFYLGKKIKKEKNKILEKSNLLVYPTKLDTFGRVVIEAMMFAIPVIANGICAIPTTIKHDKTGFILKKNTPKEISIYIERLIKNKKLREKMGIEGRKRFLQRYESKVYEKKFLKIIKSNS